jgi:hypothetical protein
MQLTPPNQLQSVTSKPTTTPNKSQRKKVTTITKPAVCSPQSCTNQESAGRVNDIINKPATSKSGKCSEPYHHAALVNSVDRNKSNKNLPQNKNSHTSQHLPLQSPYTRVYGKRKISDISPSISKLKLTNTHTTFFRPKISGQGGSRRAARALTTDPDFEMRDVISPPQGTKRSGANKSTSAEKKNKSAPKETPTPPKHYWMGFEMMEKLAIEEGATPVSTPTPIHSLIKSGFLEKKKQRNSKKQ